MKAVNLYIANRRKASKKEHFALARDMLTVTTTLYYPDHYIIAGMKRSLSLMRGFADLTASKNYICVAPLVRLQLDNALRAAAMASVPDPHKFAERVMAGDRIDLKVDRKGKKLTDRHLCEQLSVQWPWVMDIYKKGSGFVHFSVEHILVTFKGADGKPSRQFSITEDNELVQEDAYRSAADALFGVTSIFLLYVDAWISEKKRILANEMRLKEPET